MVVVIHNRCSSVFRKHHDNDVYVVKAKMHVQAVMKLVLMSFPRLASVQVRVTSTNKDSERPDEDIPSKEIFSSMVNMVISKTSHSIITVVIILLEPDVETRVHPSFFRSFGEVLR